MQRKLWLFRQGRYGEFEQRALEENKVFMSWGDFQIASSETSETLLKKLESAFPDHKPKTLLNWRSQFNQFCNEMKADDLVVIPLKTNPHIAVDRLTENSFDHSGKFRRVMWLKTDLPRTSVGQDLLYSMGASQTVCQISRNKALERIERLVKTGKENGISLSQQNSVDVISVGSENNNIEESIDVAENAKEQIERRIEAHFMGHNFTRLISEILIAQGYLTHVSPPGPDKGIDILAGQGSLGFDSPRLVVQVKSGNIVVDHHTLQSLIGCIMDTQSDQGLLVSWSGFKKTVLDRKNELYFRVRLWGREEIMDALFSVYEKLPEDIRAVIPLRRIWTLVIDEDE